MKSNIDLVRLTHDTFYLEKKWEKFFSWLDQKLKEESNPIITDICNFAIVMVVAVVLFITLYFIVR